MFVQLESFEAPMYSLHDGTVLMENPDSLTTQLDLFFTAVYSEYTANWAEHCDSCGLAIENNAQFSTIPSALSSLIDFSNLPNETFSAIETIAENIDKWREH